MCGIVGYVGPQPVTPLLLDGLSRLEYRGYDSAGIAVMEAGEVSVHKSVGRLYNLEERLRSRLLSATRGIGHTRWATHGEPSERNAHPHLDASGTIAVVHNGIIENYQELKRELTATGCSFRSETDTEVLPHLIRQVMDRDGVNLFEATRRALAHARGAYAIGVISANEPDHIVAARLGSPLIIGVGDGEYFIASDVPAILNRIRKVIYLDDGEVALLRPEGITITKLDGTPVPLHIQEVTLSAEAAEKSGFETFMLKEIHEQPRVLRNLLSRHTANGRVALDLTGFDDAYFRNLQRIMIVSCGTACHAGIYGKLLIEHLSSIAVEVDLASEFRYRDAKISPETLIVSVSQSGETADTLASVRMARGRGCKSLAICNAPGSSLVRESDATLFTEAGPEIGVASTKAYTAQQMAFALFAIALARARNDLTAAQEAELIDALREIPDAIHYVIDRKDPIKAIAEKHHDGPSSLYLGRKFNYPTALEGALKNKEISYQHAEGYAAGEMKHGPIALINEYLPVICICTKTRDEVYEKMISNMREVEARHGRIIAVASDGDDNIKGFAEDIMYVPPIRDEFSPMVNVVALQLLAYYAAQARGTDIDKPRNLAKSVTVE
ncbi:MAG TPA: glutamine--fructose-6-phosphate transaminase (isomerizing) [Kiritimatiellia bacterium]|nr:glutamine--fructose-6-phosphate transaminase (isomerizing) [Kiritimatiellia bacterium]HMO99190.1 glutamine--fructose-6-phosphate transaminase (isomerizing) [Kiritimatiellia bacterium]HMP95777.1 glutamine--fructose-6-phosphate transaminase (isomerizing) [Kiritimatiellia bacterium]